MSPSIVTLGEKGFNEFSVFLHKTIERCSAEEQEDFSFYIPPESLDILYSKEKRLGTRSQEQNNDKIDIVAGFSRPFHQKILSTLKGKLFSKEEGPGLKRTSIRIYDLGNHDLRGLGFPPYFDDVFEDDILGLVIDLQKKSKMYDKNLSYILKKYLKKNRGKNRHLLLVFTLPYKKGVKIISKSSSRKNEVKAEKLTKIGKKLLEDNLPKTWKFIHKKEGAFSNIKFFYTSYFKIDRLHPLVEEFEPLKVSDQVLLYPPDTYLSILSFIKDKSESELSQEDITTEMMD